MNNIEIIANKIQIHKKEIVNLVSKDLLENQENLHNRDGFNFQNLTLFEGYFYRSLFLYSFENNTNINYEKIKNVSFEELFSSFNLNEICKEALNDILFNRISEVLYEKESIKFENSDWNYLASNGYLTDLFSSEEVIKNVFQDPKEYISVYKIKNFKEALEKIGQAERIKNIFGKI